MSMDATIDSAKIAVPVSPESPEDRKKGDIPSYKIKNHVAIWIEGDQAFVLDQDKESSVKKIPIAELTSVFKRPGMDFIFYDAEPTLKLLASRNISSPGTVHCAHTQVILGLGHEYSVCVNGSYGTKDYSLNISVGGGRSDGISAAAADKGNTEKDGFSSKNASLRLRAKVASKDWLDLSSRYQVLDSDLDNGGGAGMDDSNNVQKTTVSTVRGNYEHGGDRDVWNLKAFMGGNKLIRRQDNPMDPAHPDSSEFGTYIGQAATTGINQSLRFSGGSRVLGGLSYKKDEGRSESGAEGLFQYSSSFEKRNSHANGLWLQHLSSEREMIFSDFGARVEQHSLAGKVFGYHAGVGVHLFDRATLFRVRLERGYKVPTLFQLYSSLGSKDLENENSLSWNTGVEQSIGPVQLKVGLFKHQLTNLIDSQPPTYSYHNIGSVESHGYELAAEALVLDEVTVKVAYGRTDHRRNDTGEALLRRPRHKANLDVSSFIGSHTRVSTGVVYIGERKDMDFSKAEDAAVDLKAYTLLTATVNYSLSSDIDVYVRGENLADTHYEEVLGYGTAGRSGYLGTSVAL